MSKEEIRALLDPYAEDLLAWSFEQIATIAKENGITPVALMMPTTRELKGIDEEWKEKLNRHDGTRPASRSSTWKALTEMLKN